MCYHFNNSAVDLKKAIEAFDGEDYHGTSRPYYGKSR